MKNKIVVITGANSGIGKATALDLAKQEAKVYMVCRNRKRGEEAQKEIIQLSKNNNVYLKLCDLSSKASIDEYGRSLAKELPHIDILINNAGAMFGDRQLSIDGLEMTFALNHMGYFLNTHYLLDLIRKGTDKRIINVSSTGHKMIRKLDFNNLQSKKGYQQMDVYCKSKLLNIYFTQELAEQLKEENITVNCLHPGVVGTNFGSSGNRAFRILMSIGRPFLMSPHNGAKTSLFLATSPKVEGISGKYFAASKEAKITPLAQNKEYRKKIWDISMQLSNIKEYGNVN